jgi:hypothetical protein
MRLQRRGRLPVHPCSIGGTWPAGGKPIGREITDRKFCWMTSLCASWEDYPRRGGLRCGAYFAALPPHRPRDLPVAHTRTARGFPPVQACPHMDGVGNAWDNAPRHACSGASLRTWRFGSVPCPPSDSLSPRHSALRCRPRGGAPLARGLARESPVGQ